MDGIRDNKMDVRTIQPKLNRFSEDLFQKTILAAKGGAKIIFWAEASGYALGRDEAAMIEKGRQICKEYGIYLGLSAYGLYNEKSQRVDGKYINNHIVFISPAGEVLADCRKKRPVPGPETDSLIESNEKLPVVDTEYGKISFAICFDGDFQDVIRQGSEASLFFLPSKDWGEITPVHTEMASLRAVENGFNIIRITSKGQSAAFDQFGRPLSVVSDFSSREGTILYADVPLVSGKTVYETLGDFFPIPAGIAAVVLAVLGFARRATRDGSLRDTYPNH